MARALLHDSDIMIFDEATSNIDAESEEDIMKVIEGLVKTKTVILISHRLVNVINSDKIYVLENGNVVEQGSHKELLQEEGSYADLYHTQAQLEYMEGDAQ